MPTEKSSDLLTREDLKQHNASLVSEEEKRRRKEAFEYARASVFLEGFCLSDPYVQEVKRFIQGEIDFPSLTAQLHKITNK